MNIIKNKQRTLILVEELLKIWEDSVKATHVFLSNEEIQNIKEFVFQALQSIPHLIIAENDDEIPVAFMGIEEHKLEMLFISSNERGKGLGKELLQYGIKNYEINELTVNEQNPMAKGFYECMGFKVYKRTDTDEQGNSYPLLYMRLE